MNTGSFKCKFTNLCFAFTTLLKGNDYRCSNIVTGLNVSSVLISVLHVSLTAQGYW